MNDTAKIARKYNKVNLWIAAGLFLVGLLVMQILQDYRFVTALSIGTVFSVITGSVYAHAWKLVAQRSPSSLGKYYIAASVLRMMAALAVVVVGVFIYKNDRSMLLGSTAIFVGFYLVTLVYDCIYFSRVEKELKFN